MKQIDAYLDSLLKNMDNNSIEVQDLKTEMRGHLMESVHELMNDGNSEEESISIAIERFGDRQTVGKPIEKRYKLYSKFINVLMVIATSCVLIFLSLLLLYNWEVNYLYSTQDALIDKADEVFKPGHQLTMDEEKQLEKLARRFTDSIFNYEFVALIRNNGSETHDGSTVNILSHAQYLYPKDTDKTLIVPNATGNMTRKWSILYKQPDFSIENYKLREFFEYSVKASIPLYLITSVLWFSWRAFIKKRIKPGWIFVFLIFNVFGYIAFILCGRKKVQKATA